MNRRITGFILLFASFFWLCGGMPASAAVHGCQSSMTEMAAMSECCTAKCCQVIDVCKCATQELNPPGVPDVATSHTSASPPPSNSRTFGPLLAQLAPLSLCGAEALAYAYKPVSASGTRIYLLHRALLI